MDPEECLRLQREAAARLLADLEGRGDYASAQEQLADVEQLAQGVQNLDQWLTAGGFLPDRWNAASGALGPQAQWSPPATWRERRPAK